MGYKKSLEDAVHYALNSKTSFGSSRHEAKTNNDASNKIFSYRTYKNYTESCERFVKFCRDNYESKTLADCRSHVNDYIQAKREEGLSNYSIKTYLSAIGKLYSHSFFKEIETGARHRADITRSRLDTESQRHYSEKNHAEEKNFFQHCGLRRSEALKIDNTCLREKDGQYYIHVENGKGGKDRDVKILNNDKATIERIKNTPDGQKVFPHLHSKMPIHEYRADFANSLYNSIASDVSTLSRSERYDCRRDMKGYSFDKRAMREVSNNLGHNRIDVIAQHYLR